MLRRKLALQALAVVAMLAAVPLTGTSESLTTAGCNQGGGCTDSCYVPGCTC